MQKQNETLRYFKAVQLLYFFSFFLNRHEDYRILRLAARSFQPLLMGFYFRIRAAFQLDTPTSESSC